MNIDKNELKNYTKKYNEYLESMYDLVNEKLKELSKELLPILDEYSSDFNIKMESNVVILHLLKYCITNHNDNLMFIENTVRHFELYEMFKNDEEKTESFIDEILEIRKKVEMD